MKFFGILYFSGFSVIGLILQARSASICQSECSFPSNSFIANNAFFVSSAVLYDKINNPENSDQEREKALEKYITLLKSGGNDYPMEQLKKAGVDLSKEEAILSLTKQLDKMLDLLEKEIENLEKQEG